MTTTTTTRRTPKYCLHKRSGRGYATFSGRQVYFDGRHGSPESLEDYHRVCAEWVACGRVLFLDDDEAMTVGDLCDRYEEHAKVYYRREDGTQTDEVGNVKVAVKPLKALYGSLPISDLGLAQLRVYRDELVRADLARTTINKRTAIIVRMVGWAVEEQIAPPTVYGELRALKALQRGRSAARETAPRQPVSEKDMNAVLPHLTPTLRALVLFLWHTGARCGEAVQLATEHVDMTGDVWLFRPPQHKGTHRGKVREIPIGAECQKVLAPYVSLDRTRPWFSPKKSDQEHKATRRRGRKTKLWPSHIRHQESKRVANPKRTAGDMFDVTAVGRAISRACKRAKVKPWTPHRLRHAALTRIRAAKGIEAAIAVGGHASIAMTEAYTRQAQRELAIKTAREIG